MKQYLKIKTKDFVEKEVKHLQDKINIIIRKSDKALKEAKKLMDNRLNNMNNIREQLDRQIETFITKPELRLTDQKVESLSKLVYIGFGIFLVLQIILVFILTIIFK